MSRWVFLFFILAATNNCYVQIRPMKEWVNNKTNGLENWNSKLSVDGISFPTTMDAPLAFEDEEQKRCRIIFPINSDRNDESKIDASKMMNSIDEKSIKSVTCPTREKLDVADALWIDPRNWKSDAISKATPHTERIPCVDDGVKFKNTDQLFVTLPAQEVTVDYILFGSTSLHAERFNTTKDAENFMRHFVVMDNRELKDILKVKNSTTAFGCVNRTGCECGTLPFFDDICDLVKEDECVKKLPLPCSQPLQPIGHCCPICGAFITAEINAETFVFAKLQAYVRSYLNALNKKHVFAHVSKTSPSNIQVVLVSDGEDESDTYDVAAQLVQLLTEPYSNATLGIQQVISHYSDPLPGDKKTWISIVRAMYAITFMSLGIGIFYAIFNSRRLIQKFSRIFQKSSTVKFENRSGRIRFDGANAGAKSALRDEAEVESKYNDAAAFINNYSK